MFYVDPVVTVLFKYWKVNWKETAQGRHRRMWLDNIKDWTKLDSYASIKRTAEDRISWRSCTQTACRPSTTEDDS